MALDKSLFPSTASYRETHCTLYRPHQDADIHWICQQPLRQNVYKFLEITQPE